MRERENVHNDNRIFKKVSFFVGGSNVITFPGKWVVLITRQIGSNIYEHGTSTHIHTGILCN